MRGFVAGALGLALLGGCVSGDGGSGFGDRASALPPSLAYRLTQSLTTEVGPRLAGTPREAAARDWAVRTLKDLKFGRVAVEPFTIKGWAREREEAFIVSHGDQALAVTALGGSISTPKAGITAPIAFVASYDDLLLAPPDAYAGKIVFINDRMKAARDGSGYGVAVRKRSRGAIEAAKRGALAVAIRSVGTDNTRFPHTGNMNYDAAVKRIPAAAVSNADADQLERLHAMGVPMRLKLVLKTRAIADAPSGNVVADIVGVEKPDEIVLLAAHLDSWDLGTGAVDDATGVAIVVAAALKAAGPEMKPKRTIRVVLYGAEEVGVHGGDAYAKAHAGEIANHVLATEADFGTGRVWRFASKALEADLPFFDSVAAGLRDLGVERGDNKSGGGADIAALAKKGVPIVGLSQDGTTYFDYHHTANDTLDKVDAAALEQNVEVYARVARAFANR
ncbi:MAG: M20/M25/M40 family metallo-hydrolase [Alphaproteobacteria bacterium]|nr:M20/M25/M40 family metallo-hydrolase [Alphaproteobacteria bacterium]